VTPPVIEKIPSQLAFPMINNGAFNFKLEHLASLPCYHGHIQCRTQTTEPIFYGTSLIEFNGIKYVVIIHGIN